jgi:hypothetical protein
VNGGSTFDLKIVQTANSLEDRICEKKGYYSVYTVDYNIDENQSGPVLLVNRNRLTQFKMFGNLGKIEKTKTSKIE